MALNKANVEKRLEGRGNLEEKANLMKLAKDEADIKFDVMSDIEGQLKELYDKLKKEGETFPEFIERVPLDKLIKLELKDGGTVVSLSQYMKQKEKPKIKKINLAQNDFEKTVADLTEEDKNVIKELLRKSGVLVGD